MIFIYDNDILYNDMIYDILYTVDIYGYAVAAGPGLWPCGGTLPDGPMA